jgi:GNAT superfamily N-acetyltransferase
MIRFWGNITNVYTMPEFRGQGIGTNLMKGIMEAARKDGIESLILWPAEGVSDFYERLGFSSDREVMEIKLK